MITIFYVPYTQRSWPFWVVKIFIRGAYKVGPPCTQYLTYPFLSRKLPSYSWEPAEERRSFLQGERRPSHILPQVFLLVFRGVELSELLPILTDGELSDCSCCILLVRFRFRLQGCSVPKYLVSADDEWKDCSSFGFQTLRHKLKQNYFPA